MWFSAHTTSDNLTVCTKDSNYSRNYTYYKFKQLIVLYSDTYLAKMKQVAGVRVTAGTVRRR